MNRERFGSRLGFLLVSAGCAIGIGNVWKFPYVTGANGGGVFVLFYLLFLVIMGAPVLTMEFAVGRASRKSAVQGYMALERPGQKWHIHGWFCFIGCALLMMYYTTVSGWMLGYFVKFVSGKFSSPEMAAAGSQTTELVTAVFTDMLADPAQMTLWMALTVIIGFTVCSFGLEKGLERVTKVMMTCLILLILLLAIHSLTLPGAGKGMRFYLLPDFGRAMEQGIWNVITAAMSQAFFTLSLGVGSMEIFGSYMSKENTLAGEALTICGLDTFVALMAGFIIFPACYSFGVEPDAGPALIFITLPNVFVGMSVGRIGGSLFFLFMSFASFSTVIAVFEMLIATMMELTEWNRRKVSLILCLFMLAASMPCVLGYNIWSGVRLIGGRDVLDSEDFIVSNLLLPVGSLVYLLFCTTRFGWGFENYLAEANTGKGPKIPMAFKPYFRYVLPVLILVILLIGLV